MSDLPLVSIVLTVFNGEQFLRDQLNSFLLQIYRNFEVIAVDDGSTDSSSSILHEFSKKHPDFFVFTLPRNMGQIDALEYGLRAARGKYIAISDQDDIWFPNKISKLLSSICGASAVFSDSILVGRDGSSLNRRFVKDYLGVEFPPACCDPLWFIGGNIVSGHALMFEKELVDILLPFSRAVMFDQQIAIGSAVTGGLHYLDSALVSHRIHEGNTTNKLLKKHRSIYSKEQRAARSVEKAQMFSRLLDCVLNIYRRKILISSCAEDKNHRELFRLRTSFGKMGVLPFLDRLFRLLKLKSRLFIMLSGKRKIQKSWQLALNGYCVEVGDD